MRWIKLLAGLVAGVLLMLGAAGLYGLHYYRAPGPLLAERHVVIAPGTSFSAISQQLVSEGVIEHDWLFKAVVAATGDQGRFKAGEYKFMPGMSPQNVSALLVSGKSVVHSVTVPEGRIVEEIAGLLRAEEVLQGEVPAGLKEGSLLPETYFFLRGDTRQAVAKRMQDAMSEALAAGWEARKEGLPLHTPEEALVLASIVEKETGMQDERGRVAAVFINRLTRGMPLQSDPTTIYGLYKRSGQMRLVLTRSDLESDTPYNTYRIAGLPPGPICNPGRASLQAVMNPPETNELYFVADGNGGHRFAATLKEHNENVARYRAALKRAQRTAEVQAKP